jgi:hypothetical protein
MKSLIYKFKIRATVKEFKPLIPQERILKCQ